jgi:hypothetical protein
MTEAVHDANFRSVRFHKRGCTRETILIDTSIYLVRLTPVALHGFSDLKAGRTN